MAEWLVGPVMDKIINTCFEYLQNPFTWQTGMKKELERLRENHPKITSVISAARRAQIIDQNSALNKWIWQLRDAIDEADDLLDDFECMKHQQQLDRNKEEKKECSYVTSIFNTAKRLCLGDKDPLKSKPDLKRLEEAVHNLDRISAEVSTFLYLLENIKQEQREQQVELHKTRETGSLPKNDLIGRGKDKYSVIEWLRKPSNGEPQTHATTATLYNNISLLSIVGHGGMGKTTLLQHVYADEMVKEFDLKMWVCVSDNFDVKKVITDMLESINHSRFSLETLDALQKSLQSKVMSKRFLLVLDDLWDKEEEIVLHGKWGDVLAPLAYGGLGSKILITTRMDSVASMIAKVIRKKKEALRLDGLEEDECLQLLTTHAFDDVENTDDYKKLRSIAVELVKKLCGSPLAAKVMGGVLNSSLDERYWRNVFNSSLGLNGIFPILNLSYIFLPQHLRSCFSFCSIFEQDHIFDKEDLVRMWIAVGFIQPSHNNQGEDLTLEDIGESCFDVLIKKSFFNKVSTGGYKMHDLLHELAQSVSNQECFKFVGDEKSLFLEIPETIRHLSVKTNNCEVLQKMERFKNLRSLFITSYNKNNFDVLNEMFKATKSIHLLHIKYNLQKMIPENIRYLHHLRYLSMQLPRYRLPRFGFGFHSNEVILPRFLCSLYNLQFLTSNGAPWNSFPGDMNNLCNLRYLSSERLNFPGIGKLKFLQKLAIDIKNENGYRVDELEHMNDVRFLKINSLENVMDAEEASNAKLCDKRKLKHLSLHWRFKERDIEARDLDERVLDNLQPHNYLKTLCITNYKGAKSAIWMNESHLINNLEKIELYWCLEWEILPPFGQLPFLKTLKLLGMPKVKRLENKFHGNDMCCVFPSLETLHIIKLEALVDWFDASVVDRFFPCLTKLQLSCCPNLQELPYLPPNLQLLNINNIGWKTLNSYNFSKSIPFEILDACLFSSLTKLRLSNCPNLQELPYLPPKLQSLNIDNIGWKTLNCCSISKSITLKTLEVHQCPNITSISLAGEIGKLTTLTITNCPNLISLGEEHQEVDAVENCMLDLIISDLSVLQMEALRSCTSIRSLMIKDNDELVSFPLETEQWLLQVSSSLRTLHFMNLRSLQSLPSSLASISSLQRLFVNGLPQLRELPDLPPSKKNFLSIENCDGDLMKRYKPPH